MYFLKIAYHCSVKQKYEHPLLSIVLVLDGDNKGIFHVFEYQF